MLISILYLINCQIPEKGKSSYALSDEEAEAIQKAMNSENRIKLQ